MFKVGDKVKLRKGLIEGQKYDGLTYWANKHFDGVGTIIEICGVPNLGCYWYHIDAGISDHGHPWAYTDDILIPVAVAHRVALSKDERKKVVTHE